MNSNNNKDTYLSLKDYEKVEKEALNLGLDVSKENFIFTFLGGSKAKGTDDSKSDNDYFVVSVPSVFQLMYDKKPFNHAFKVDLGNDTLDDVRVLNLDALYKILLKHDDYSYSLLYSLLSLDNSFVNSVLKDFKDKDNLRKYLEVNRYSMYKSVLNTFNSNLIKLEKELPKLANGKLLVELLYDLNLVNKTVEGNLDNYSEFEYKEFLTLKRLNLDELKCYDYSKFKYFKENGKEVNTYMDLLSYLKGLDFSQYDKEIFKASNDCGYFELAQQMTEDLRNRLAKYIEYFYKNKGELN